MMADDTRYRDAALTFWGVAIVMCGLVLAGDGCEAEADEITGATVGIVPTGEPDTSYPVPPSPPTLSLANRMRSWLRSPSGPLGGHWRLQRRGADRDIDSVARAAEAASSQAPGWPSAELLCALSFRESSWRPRARGKLNEVGLAQLHPAHFRHPRIWDPEVNLRLAAERLRECMAQCGDELSALRCYGTGGTCTGASYAERRVHRWARQIREAR